MASSFEKTISVSEFKATCLELLDAVASHRLDRLHLTKRGKPYLTLAVTLPLDAPTNFDALYGSMKDTTGIPDDFDWNAPLVDSAEIEKMVDTTLSQLQGQ